MSQPPVKRTTTRAFVFGGLLVAVVLALVVSGFASSSPDGLEKVAEDKGFLATATDHLFADGPLAGYTVEGVDNERLSTGFAGVIGVALTFAVGLGLFRLARRRDTADGEGPPAGRSGERDDRRDRTRSG